MTSPSLSMMANPHSSFPLRTLTHCIGPYIYLRSIVDQFDAAGAKATFFMNGNNWECIYDADRISDVKYAYAAGHMIGSHTWSHADLPTLSTPQIKDAMYRMEEAFSRILGIRPAFMRPPYGDYNANIQSIAAARGQSLALWDWDTGDADGNTTAQSEALYQDVVKAKVKNALILNHETEETTANTLVPYALNLFKSKGYNLVTMAECLGVAPYQAVGVAQKQTSAWTCNGTPNPGAACGGAITCQTGTPSLSTSTATSTPTATGSGHTIRPGSSGTTCLTASSNSNGATVIVEPCSGSASQSWTQNGATLIVHGNKCLDVTNGNTANGVKMQIWTCTPGQGDAAQHYTITDKRIQWTGKDKCLDLTGGSLSNGNRVQMWACTAGNTNQVWKIV